jgi:hypothetical protein
MYGCLPLGCIGNNFLKFLQEELGLCNVYIQDIEAILSFTYQVVKDTLVELPLCRSTLPELLIVVI